MNKICPFCGSGNIVTERNIGSDIDPAGCEDQHIDKCECGSWRFNIDRYENFETYRNILGKWYPKDDSFLHQLGLD